MFHHSRDVPAFDYTGDFTHFLEQLFVPGSVEHVRLFLDLVFPCCWLVQASLSGSRTPPITLPHNRPDPPTPGRRAATGRGRRAGGTFIKHTRPRAGRTESSGWRTRI